MPSKVPKVNTRKVESKQTSIPSPVGPPASVTPFGSAGVALIAEETPQVGVAPPPSGIARGELLTRDFYRTNDFWTAINAMTEADWQDKLCYLYRLEPRAVSRKSGLHGSIEKYVHGFSIEDVELAFGGGVFDAWLKQGKETLARVKHFRIPGPPKWTPDEIPENQPAPLAGANGNDGSSVALLKTVLEEIRAERESADDGDDDAVATSVEIMADAARQSNALIAQAHKPAPLAEQVALIKSILELAPKPASNPIIDKLLEKMIERSLNPNPTGGAAAAIDPVDQLTKVFDMYARMKEIIPAEKGGRISPWITVIQTVLPEVKGIAKELIGLWAAARGQQQARFIDPRLLRAPAAPEYVDPRFNPQLGPQFGREPAQRPRTPGDMAEDIGFAIGREVGRAAAAQEFPFMPPGSGAPPSGPVETGSEASPITELPGPQSTVQASPHTAIVPPEVMELLVKQKILKMFYQGDEGQKAAEHLEEWAPWIFAAVSQVMDVDVLLQITAADPILGQMAADPRARQFLAEMIEYFQDEGDEEEKEAAEELPN